MMLACVVPLAIILFSTGASSTSWGSIVLFLVLMFACHFMMMSMMHGEHSSDKKQKSKKEV